MQRKYISEKSIFNITYGIIKGTKKLAILLGILGAHCHKSLFYHILLEGHLVAVKYLYLSKIYY